MAESERQEGVLQLGEIRQAVSALSIADTANHGQSVLTLRKGSNEEPCALIAPARFCEGLGDNR